MDKEAMEARMDRAATIDPRMVKTTGPRAIHPTIEQGHKAAAVAEQALDQLRAYKAELEQELGEVNATIDHVAKRLGGAINGPNSIAATPGYR